MSKIDIATDGYCINKVIDRLKSKIGATAAEQLKQTAVEVVQNCVDVYSTTFGSGDVGTTGTGIVSQPHKGKIADGTTGLIYGKVQSGKTNTTIATLALAQANHFRCFIVLTSDNTCLGEQTAGRFADQLKGGPVVFNWQQWRNDPEDFAINQLLDYIKDTGVVLVSTKNKSHLDSLLKVLKFVKASSVPTLIFDDEADNASPNTNEAKQAKKGKETVPDSAIFEKRLKNRPAKDGSGTWIGTSGFTSPEWVNKAKQEYPNVPTLIVILEQGREEDGWEDLSFYLPTLVLPKNKFVFMFNYSDTTEELEDDIDLQDSKTST